MIFLFIWLLCWLLCYGMCLAHQNSISSATREDAGMSVIFGFMFSLLGGPIGVFICWLVTGFAENGLKFKI